MNKLISTRVFAAAALVAGLAYAPAIAQPGSDGTIDFHGGSVAFIAGVHWGGGTLHFHGRNVPLRVSGIGVGEIGANSFNAVGRVYHLRKVSDIEGVYAAINANATAGAGAGEVDMKNDKGVEIHAHATSSGLKLALAPTGVNIAIK
jgi:hypothetical protein